MRTDLSKIFIVVLCLNIIVRFNAMINKKLANMLFSGLFSFRAMISFW